MNPTEENGDQSKSLVRGTLKTLVGVAGKGAAAVGRGARWAAPHVANGSKKTLTAARAGAVGVVSRIRKSSDSPTEDGPR